MKQIANFYQENEKFLILMPKIDAVVSDSLCSNQALNYYLNDSLKSSLIYWIAKNLVGKHDVDTALRVIQQIFQKYDFRWVSDYLYALQADNIVLQNLFENELDDSLFQEKLNIERMQRLYPHLSAISVIYQKNIEDIFSNPQDGHSAIFLFDLSFKPILQKLIEQTRGQIGCYLDSHYDLAGINSLVRKGLVKLLQLYFGWKRKN